MVYIYYKNWTFGFYSRNAHHNAGKPGLISITSMHHCMQTRRHNISARSSLDLPPKNFRWQYCASMVSLE